MNPRGNTGSGAIATRGLLVQTLVALLDVTKSEPPFDEVTLEPNVGETGGARKNSKTPKPSPLAPDMICRNKRIDVGLPL